MKKHLQIGNWSHFSGEARQPNGDPRLITTMKKLRKIKKEANLIGFCKHDSSFCLVNKTLLLNG